MGSQSRRYRASESALVYLYLFLFLCLGFLSRPVDYGHTRQLVHSGAWIFGEGPSETLATANPGALNLEQWTSKVIALASSPTIIIVGHGSSIKNNFSAMNIWAEWGFQYSNCDFQGCLERLKIDSPALFPSYPNGTTCYVEISTIDTIRIRPGQSLTCVCRLSDAVYERNSLSWKYFERRQWTLSQLYLGSGNELWEVDPPRRPWFMVGGMEQIELAIDYRISKGTSTESPLNLPSNSICLDSIPKLLLRDETIEIMGTRIKKLFHIDKSSNDTRVSPDNDFELSAQVISVVLAGITTLVVMLIMQRKRIKNVILFKSNNELNALISEELDSDESFLTDRNLHENLLRDAELISSAGSSGKVFKVRFFGREWAMKVFHSYARMDFRKESVALLNLSHPNVVELFCIFRKSSIVLELMDEDLYSFITKIRERRIDYEMPLEVALDVMLQIAEGMSYLHNQGIAHQDLKSLNILLKLRGEFHGPDFRIIAKIADLGSARLFNPRDPESFVLVRNMNIGTRSWRAPELFHPCGGFWAWFFGINPRVLPKPLDIYGFAVICSELLTKQIPFSTDQDLRVADLASRLREGHRPALPTSGCPEGLLTLIKDCWHGDPVLRPEFHEVCRRLIEVKSSSTSHGERLSES